MKPTFKITDDESNPPYWWINDFLERIMELKAKFIDDKIKEFWITEGNAKDYHIEIKKTNAWDIYNIYRKEKVWEFIVN